MVPGRSPEAPSGASDDWPGGDRCAHPQGLTYVKVHAFVKDNGRLTGVVARDLETDDEIRIRARVVINATGVFSDALRSLIHPSHQKRVLASRGTHIVLPLGRMSPTRGLLILKTRDGRVLFLLPWQGVLLAGTTDIAVSQASLEPAASRAEVEYILEHLAEYLEPAPSVNDCLSVFAGLRPLIQARPGKSTSSLSREHAVVVDPSGLVSLIGGKWTTFRLMGEDTVDKAARVGGLPPTARKGQLWIADCPPSSEPETWEASDPFAFTAVSARGWKNCAERLRLSPGPCTLDCPIGWSRSPGRFERNTPGLWRMFFRAGPVL